MRLLQKNLCKSVKGLSKHFILVLKSKF